MDGVIQYDWVEKGGVRREGITLSWWSWLDFNLGASAQDEAGPLGPTDAWDAWQAGEEMH